MREAIHLDGIALTLVDTAGLRESADEVEREGIRRAHAELARADVAILVTDTESVSFDRQLLANVAAGATPIIVHNKIDLAHERARTERDEEGALHIALSARTGDGLPLLRDALRRLGGATDAATGTFSARTRHVVALRNVARHLQAAADHLKSRTGELAAEELRAAQQSLGEITGEFRSDDLLGAIFSTFCIGK